MLRIWCALNINDIFKISTTLILTLPWRNTRRGKLLFRRNNRKACRLTDLQRLMPLSFLAQVQESVWTRVSYCFCHGCLFNIKTLSLQHKLTHPWPLDMYFFKHLWHWEYTFLLLCSASESEKYWWKVCWWVRCLVVFLFPNYYVPST